MVMTTSLALLLSRSCCGNFALLEVCSLVSRVRAGLLVGVMPIALEARMVVVCGVLELLLRNAAVDGQVLEQLVACSFLFADDLLLMSQELLLGLLNQAFLV